MKKTLIAYCIVGIATIGAFAVPAHYAYAIDACPAGTIPGPPGQGCITKETSDSLVRETAAKQAAEGPKYYTCSIAPWDFHLGACLRDFSAYFLILQVQLLLFFLGIAGAILDLALTVSFSMGSWAGHGTDIGKAISLGWTIFRDVGNLGLIAGLIWASIAMILGINAGANPPGKLVVNVIIVAILVNFSYFFTGVLIDASNTLSKVVYETQLQGIAKTSAPQAIAGVAGAVGSPIVSTSESATAVKKWLDGINVPYLNTPFSGIFLEQTKITSILDPKFLAANTAENHPYDGKFFALMVFATIIFGTVIYNFATMAISILARLVILIILLVTAPVMVLKFTGMEPFKKWGDHWWGALSSQLVFLPVFLLLSMISFSIIGQFAHLVANGPAGESGITLGLLGGITSKDWPQVFNALGNLLIFAMGWGLLRASRKIAHDIATQTETELPKVGLLQNPALKGGEMIGKVATQLAMLPRTLGSKLLFGGGARVIGGGLEVGKTAGGNLYRMTPVPALIRRVSDTLNKIPRAFEGMSDEGRRKAAERKSISEMEPKILQTIADLNSSDIKVREAAEKRMAGWLQDPKIKKQIAKVWNDPDKVTPEQQNDMLKTLPEDKRKDVAGELDRLSRSLPKERPKPNKQPPTETVAEATSRMTDRHHEIANGIIAGNQQLIEEFTKLEYLERRRILIARREILADKENTTRIAEALGKEKFGEHVVGLPDEHLRDPVVLANSAPHMTFETYKTVHKKLQEMDAPMESFMALNKGIESADPDTAARALDYRESGARRFKVKK